MARAARLVSDAMTWSWAARRSKGATSGRGARAQPSVPGAQTGEAVASSCRSPAATGGRVASAQLSVPGVHTGAGHAASVDREEPPAWCEAAGAGAGEGKRGAARGDA